MPPDGGSQDSRQTREAGPVGARHPGAGRPAPAAAAGNGGNGRLRRWGIGITAAAVLVSGGGAAAVALWGASPAAASGSATRAAALNATLSSAASPTAGGGCRRLAAQLRADGHPRAARAVRRACRLGAVRLRAVGGIHGQVTYETRTGVRTLAYERGVIQSASGSAVIVRAPDGTTWTWELVSDTVVRQDGERISESALSDGQRVFVGGPVSGGSNDARLIVIRAAGAAGRGAAGSGTSELSSAP